MHNSRRSTRGMTLVELMTVVAIIAIFAALAGPSFREYFEKVRVRGAADAVASLFTTARAEAVKQDRDVVVSVAGTTDAWCAGANLAEDPESPGDPIPDAVACDCSAGVCSLGDIQAVVDGASFRGVTVNAVGDAIVFDSKLGTLDIDVIEDFDPVSIDLSSPSGRFALRVSVSALGHVRACVPSGYVPISGYSDC